MARRPGTRYRLREGVGRVSPVRLLCAQCGAVLSPNGRFCVSCGAPAEARAAGRAPAETGKGVKAQMLKQLRDATLGEYEILIELGSGGMATVYLAHDLQLDRRVAIKLMHPTLTVGSDMVERFILEARTAAGLSHHNIIPIYAVKVQEDLLYFVMKYVEGRPLDSIIRAEAPLGADMVRQIVTQVADALAYAHRRGVIHRDIKPANIIISTEGQPILADFGIAKVADKPGLTLTGATIGTPTYMSPEQCDAQPVTGASDQYSLGVTAYEALTGKPPFDAPSYMTIMMKQMTQPARPVSEVVPDCPRDLANTIDRMLAKAPTDRFATMDEVVEALRTATVSSQQTVQTQLVQFALADPRRELVKRVSTPQSPIPTAARRTRVAESNVPAAPSRNRLFLAGALAVGLVAGALMMAQPWKRGHAAADSTTAPVPPATAAVDSNVVIPQEQPAAPAEPATRPPPAPAPPQPATVSPGRTAPVAVSAIRVTGPESLSVGGSGTVHAALRDVRGQPVTGRAVTWTSSATDVASVDAAGELQARAPGRAVITAAIEGIRQTFAVTVVAEPVSAVAVTPAALSLSPGESASLVGQASSSGGRVLDRPLDWNSSAPGVATVTASGRVTAVAPGSAVISAGTGGKTGTATVTVTAPAPAPAPAAVAEATPSDAERRAQITAIIAAYAQALQNRNLARVRELYPTMPASAEQKLRQALPGMDDLQVHLSVGQVDFVDAGAMAQVTGSWTYRERGKRETLPADNRYRLERRGTGWVITEIR